MRSKIMWTDKSRPLNKSIAPTHRNSKEHYGSGFDAESGQVFTETVVAVRGRQHSDWIGQLKTPSLSKKATPNTKGARSLIAMATAKIIAEVRDLSKEHFQSLPVALAKEVWHKAEDR